MSINLIIAGGRDYGDYDAMCMALEPYQDADVTVISGDCRGADRLGQEWAHDFNKPIRLFPADWRKHGKAAGPIRNRDMAKVSDVAVVFWDGKSRGTKNMINEARRAGMELTIVMYVGGNV